MRGGDVTMPILTGVVVATFALLFLSPLTAALPGPDLLPLGVHVAGAFVVVAR